MSTLTIPHGPTILAGNSRAERRVLAVARWPVGGIRTHVVYTYPALADAGYQFTFVVPGDGSLPTFARSLESIEGCEFVGVPTRGRRCPLWSEVRRQARTGRYGLIHSHGLTAAVNAVIGNVGVGLPHLTTVHDIFRPDQFIGLKGRMKRWLLARLVGRISTVVSVSHDVRDNLLDYLPSAGRGPRHRVIPNGIDTSHYGDAVVDRRGDSFVLGFLGRFMEQKGATTLLQAMQALRLDRAVRPFRLLAVGSGDQRGLFRREVTERGLADIVVVQDFTPDALPALRQLDLLVVPSLWEASSLVSMEAMCVGVPVLGSDCIGLREVLRGTPSRQFAAGDPVSLANELRRAMAAPWDGEARSFAPLARERFDVRHAAEGFLDEFDRLFVASVRRA